MKHILAILLLMVCTTSFSQKKEWKEMHDFHAVIGKLFHPAEENKLQPTRDSASLLLTQAKLWQKSVVPEGYNAAVTKPILKKLVSRCTVLVKAVKQKQTDEELKALITGVHETFHEIMEKCAH